MSLWLYGWSALFGVKRILIAWRSSQRSSANERPYGPKLWSFSYGYALTLLCAGAMMSIWPRHFHSYCGTMPLKLNRSSKVKSVPDTASVRCADEMRRTRRRVGTYTQVSSFRAVAFGPNEAL